LSFGHFITAAGRLSIHHWRRALDPIFDAVERGGWDLMYDEDLTNFEDGLRRLKIEYHIFFSGNRKNPPDDLRIRVENIVKRLSECSDMSFSQRFRFSTLVTRFYVYKDLWRRTTQSRELDVSNKEAPARKADTSPRNAGNPAKAISISISDPKAEEEKVRRLYDALVSLKGKESQQTPISYQQFAKYIATQTSGIQKKHGCTNVAFTIALDEDAIRFTAAAEKR
jgi:hypothetical protein